MKCLLIMTFIFINGLENAELKSRHTGTILREDDLDTKAKAWLLMVESGKADEDHTRKITPKSIFIAPLLTSRSNKCKEGYTHDHLGQCVKVIKMDQKTQLELLLKRLSAMYGDKKEEGDGLSHISSGPLQFSLPISSADTTAKDDSNSSAEVKNTTVVTPAELSNKTKDNGLNETDEIEYSGSGALDEPLEGSGWEGSGLETDDPCGNETTESATLISDELDYTEAQEYTTDITSTEVPYTTEIYESAINDSDFITPTEQTNEEYHVTEKKIVKQVRPDKSRIVFPDSLDIATEQRQTRPHHPVPSYHPWTPVGNLRPNSQFDVGKLPTQQFWWLPPNWRVDEENRKPAVFKFWSHLPLVRDPSFAGETQDAVRRPLVHQYSEAFHPSTRIPEGFKIEFQQPLSSNHRRGRVFGTRRINTNVIQPRSLHIR